MLLRTLDNSPERVAVAAVDLPKPKGPVAVVVVEEAADSTVVGNMVVVVHEDFDDEVSRAIDESHNKYLIDV